MRAIPPVGHLKLPILAMLVCLVGSLLVAASPVGLGALPGADAATKTYYAEVKFSGYRPYCQFIGTLRLADRHRSEGCFDSPYDDFAVVDTSKDGKSVAILWTLGKSKRGICRNKLGKGDVNKTWPTCRYDAVIPEHHKITAWLSTCDVTAKRTCHKWGDWRKTKLLKRVYKTTKPADGN